MGGGVMNFGSLLAYIELYDSGRLWKDMTYKSYDLLWKATDKRLRKALQAAGFRHDEVSISLAECATRICERGYCGLSVRTVRTLVLEWYVWWGLEHGGYRKWKYRKSQT
jgi:hypothetical protein